MSKSTIDPIIEAIDKYADKAYDMGVNAERERILDLPLIHEGWDGKHREVDCVTCENIALIKGENE